MFSLSYSLFILGVQSYCPIMRVKVHVSGSSQSLKFMNERGKGKGKRQFLFFSDQNTLKFFPTMLPDNETVVEV